MFWRFWLRLFLCDTHISTHYLYHIYTDMFYLVNEGNVPSFRCKMRLPEHFHVRNTKHGSYLNWLQCLRSHHSPTAVGPFTPQSHRCWAALQLHGTSIFLPSVAYMQKGNCNVGATRDCNIACALCCYHITLKNKDFFTLAAQATLGVTNLKDTLFCRCFCCYYHVF